MAFAAVPNQDATFEDIKIGHDTPREQDGSAESDDDIDDAGDDIVWTDDFGGTSKTPAYDHAGNMIDDGTFVYVYDAWNRLVKVRSKESANVTIQTSEFDGLGRRIKKVVTNAGDYNKTEVYFYDGQRIVQINNGSGTMVQQFIHGTQYIDELVMVRVADKGDLYVQQDANWNVIGLTDLGRHVVERNVYTPYGELTVHQDTGFGDRDGDQDVDSTDKGTVGTTCTGTVSGSCRILDLEFDGDYDAADATKFDALTQGAMRHPGRPATIVSQPFAHQGLLFEPELTQYQNRARQYDPGKRRFAQRDSGEARVSTHTLLRLVLVNDSTHPVTVRGGILLNPTSNRFERPAASSTDRQYQDGLGLYSYVGGNPVGALDPSGFCACSCIGICRVTTDADGNPTGCSGSCSGFGSASCNCSCVIVITPSGRHGEIVTCECNAT